MSPTGKLFSFVRAWDAELCAGESASRIGEGVVPLGDGLSGRLARAASLLLLLLLLPALPSCGFRCDPGACSLGVLVRSLGATGVCVLVCFWCVLVLSDILR